MIKLSTNHLYLISLHQGSPILVGLLISLHLLINGDTCPRNLFVLACQTGEVCHIKCVVSCTFMTQIHAYNHDIDQIIRGFDDKVKLLISVHATSSPIHQLKTQVSFVCTQSFYNLISVICSLSCHKAYLTFFLSNL